MMNTDIELVYFIEATVYLWIAEWLQNNNTGVNIIPLLMADEDEDEARQTLYKILLDFVDFLDVTIDRSALVNAISKEWGVLTTPRREEQATSVGCQGAPVLENGVNKVTTVNIAGMDIEVEYDPSDCRWLHEHYDRMGR